MALPTLVPSLNASYETEPLLSVEALQLSTTALAVAPLIVRLPGAVGGVVSAAGEHAAVLVVPVAAGR